MNDGPTRILFVFAWLVVGGEETEVRHLARALDPNRYRIDAVACLRTPEMPDLTHRQLEALGIDVDRTPYDLSFEETVAYLAGKIPGYDIVVACQNPPDVYPALERLHLRPPLIEHGGLVSEALTGPKNLTTRYVGVCRSIREAAASRMPGREHQALEIPSIVDLKEFRVEDRGATRAALGIGAESPLIGWVGRLDAKKRVEDFIEAAALVHARAPAARFLVIGGPDAFMPEYAERLVVLAGNLGLKGTLRFLGDRDDVPALLSALDVFVWLSRGEGMPHVIGEAGAASLPVIATADNGSLQQIEDSVSGMFVPHESPGHVADAILRLIGDPRLRAKLGAALRRKVEATYSVEVVVSQWEALFDAVRAEARIEPARPTLFRSFLQGGFECSTHRRRDGRRLDLIAATAHDRHAESDYRQLATFGMRTVRDGFRWHLIERAPGRYDWSSIRPMIAAAARTQTQVIWDLLHFGFPDDLDIWRPAFVNRFARFARAAAAMMREETDEVAFYTPVNEISFFAWAGGDAAYLNPFAQGRGPELKAQLVRASLAAIDGVLDVDSLARFVHCEPVINVIPDPARPETRKLAETYTQAQFESWDMIRGDASPQLGGTPRHLDIVGVNYYCNNQWVHERGPIGLDHPLYKPFRRFLAETYARYGRPIFVAETGIEGERRPSWLAHIADEVIAAMQAGVPAEGICIYPIVNHLGWDDDRDCPNGLLDANFMDGRKMYEPLGEEIARQQALRRWL